MVDWWILKLLADTGCNVSMWRVGKRVGLARQAIRQGADMPVWRNLKAPTTLCSGGERGMNWRGQSPLGRLLLAPLAARP